MRREQADMDTRRNYRCPWNKIRPEVSLSTKDEDEDGARSKLSVPRATFNSIARHLKPPPSTSRVLTVYIDVRQDPDVPIR